MSKKVTSVKTHYPDVIQKLTWDVCGAAFCAGLSAENVEKVEALLARAYNMGHRDGYEKAKREGEYYVEATRRYSQKIDQVREFLAETLGWEWQENDDEWD